MKTVLNRRYEVYPNKVSTDNRLPVKLPVKQFCRQLRVYLLTGKTLTLLIMNFLSVIWYKPYPAVYQGLELKCF